jgi:hypothetical protein
VADFDGLARSIVRELGHPARIMQHGTMGWKVMLLILFDKILVTAFGNQQGRPVSY